MKGLIIIPTYNERDNIIQLIDDIFSRSFPNAELDILVIDDNSPDGTGNLIEKNQALNNHLYLIQREKKLGLASAYIAGFKFGLSQDYELFFEMDADYSHNPNYLQDFLLTIRD
ncbi:MAG: glycosyltransferase, partial [Candidatus Helarchaeota archaeon]|nr:glycosyltransferase [Candidatus Helarchaeota archaeon]